MDIKELQTFVEVAAACGISPAAIRLGVSKSIVSRRLGRLETDLGVQLFSRTARGAVLTEAGVAFQAYAKRICDEVNSAKETISPECGLRGRLRIAAPLSLGSGYFASVLAEMARRSPQLHIHTEYGDSVVDAIAQGCDCAISVGYFPRPDLRAARVGQIRASAVASPAYIRAHGTPETPDQLSSHEVLMQGREPWRFLQGDETISIEPRGRFKADHCIALVAAAVAGLGIAYVPNIFIQDHLMSGTLVRVLTRYPSPPAETYVVWPPAEHLERKVRVLTEMLTAYLQGPPFHEASGGR